VRRRLGGLRPPAGHDRIRITLIYAAAMTHESARRRKASTQEPSTLLLRSFPPIADRDATVLILGSMPSAASLAAGQYYAHPRNAFWPIMSTLLALPIGLPYALRIAALKARGLALWDVIESCARTGSLDAGIIDSTLIPHDFNRFFRTHPHIQHVCFNGAKAASAYRRFVPAAVRSAPIRYTRLPSTSPAHAALSLAAKTRAWRAALDEFRLTSTMQA
ncbi:MAG: DNA-deoxyinosine glycosylase, partial [Gammaproteobacteria bacterium]